MNHYQRLDLYTGWVTTIDGREFQVFVNIERDGVEDDIFREIEDIWNEEFAKLHGDILPDSIQFEWTPGAYVLPYNQRGE